MADQVQVDAMASGYVYLKNISGTVIKPITDLSGINMTTTNGIAVVQTNGGTIGIRDGYIESCYYNEMVDPGVGPANVDSSYIEGGTMFQLIGGYTVTDEIPPITGASHEKIPSEYSVRSAIDALATLGPSLAPGAGIVVETVPGATGGTIAVAPGNGINVATAQQGGVSVVPGPGIAVDSSGVSFNNDTVDAATPDQIVGSTAAQPAKVIQADDLEAAIRMSENLLDLGTAIKAYWSGNISTVDGVTTLYGKNISDGALNGELRWAGTALNFLTYGHSYIAIADVKFSGCTSAFFYTGNAAAAGGNTVTTANTWDRIYRTLTLKSDANLTYLGLCFGLAGAAQFTFEFKNLRLIDVTGIPVALWTNLINNEGYLYEGGDGITVNGKSISVDEATPMNMLDGVSDKSATPNSIKSAFSVGQAVDCTSEPSATFNNVLDSEGNVPVVPGVPSPTVKQKLAVVYRDTFTLSNNSASGSAYLFGFMDGAYYPKVAATANGTPLQYLFICNVKNNDTTYPIYLRGVISRNASSGNNYEGAINLLGNDRVDPGQTVRFAMKFPAHVVSNVATNTLAYMVIEGNSTTAYNVTLSKCRQFEVMALTDDAVKYLAGVTDPDNTDDLYMIKNDMVDPWISIIDMKSAPAVTIASGLAYKSTVASGSTCTFSTDTVPAGAYGKDAHLTLFVGQDSQIIFQQPLNLMDPLTPGAGHNMTIKYRDGQALAYVDDTNVGYVVTVTAGTGSGSLYDGLAVSADKYVVFSHNTDGTPFEYDWISTSYSKSIIGNGADATIISTPVFASYTQYSNVCLTEAAAGSYSVVFNNCSFQDASDTAIFVVSWNGNSTIMYGSSSRTDITGCTFTNVGTKIDPYPLRRPYSVGNMVWGSNTTVHECIKAIADGSTDVTSWDNAEYWLTHAYKGEWAWTNSYNAGDCVIHSNSGSCRVAVKDVPANTATFNETEYWRNVSYPGYAMGWGIICLYSSSDNILVNNVFDSCGNGANSLIFSNAKLIKGNTFTNCYGAITQYGAGCTFEDNTFVSPNTISAVFGNATNTDFTFTFRNNVFSNVPSGLQPITIQNGTVVLTGTNVFSGNTTIWCNNSSGRVGKLSLADEAVVDITNMTLSNHIFCDSSLITSIGTATILYNEVVGGTTTTKSYVVGPGTGTRIMDNGRLGYPVTNKAATTAANTLYDALVGGGTPYTNVCFDTTLDGQTISLASGTTVSTAKAILGNGADASNTVIGNGVVCNANTYNVALEIRDCICNLTVWPDDNMYGNLIVRNIISDGAQCQNFSGNTGLLRSRRVKVIGSTISGVQPKAGSSVTQSWGVISTNGWTDQAWNEIRDTLMQNNAIHCTMAYDCWLIDNSRFINNYNGVCLINGISTVSNCYFEGNGETITDGSDYALSYGGDYCSPTTLYVTGCTFAYSATGRNKLQFKYNTRTPANVGLGILSDNTLNANVLVEQDQTVRFVDTNVLGGTVYGAGTVVFADGATVTSPIPSGSTIGTGVIRALNHSQTNNNPLGSDILIENVTITGCTSVGPLFKVGSTTANTTIRNCVITGNTLSNGTGGDMQATPIVASSASNEQAGILYLEKVTITNNAGGNSDANNGVYVYVNSVIFMDDCRSGGLVSVYNGVLVLGGTNFANGGIGLPSDNASGKIVFKPDSVSEVPAAFMAAKGTGMFYVGTYDEATGTVTTIGTATAILNGTTVSISGSGNTIDSTGLHS